MKNVLMFRGGWDGHDPVLCSDAIADELRKQGYNVDISDSQDALLATDLTEKYQLIVPVWTMGKLEKEAGEALLSAVRESGVAVGGWHGGMGDAFRENTEFQFMVGGQWVAHPGNIIDYEVALNHADHPILCGIPRKFPVHSEQYYMHVDPSNNVLATTTFSGDNAYWIDGTVMPVIWTRCYGKGRVFYTSLGHNFEDFKNTPEIIKIIVNGLKWALADL